MSKGADIRWGKGAKIGTFYPTLEIDGKEVQLFGVFSNGKIEIVFQGFPLSREAKSRLIEEINSIGKISLPEKAVDTWAGFPLVYLEDDQVLERFIKIFEKTFSGISAG